MHRYFEVNEGGHNIRCKLYFQDLKNIRQIVVFCHGFGGHKDNGAAERFAQKLISKHKSCALVTFNWPCHGDDVKKKLSLVDCHTYLTLLLQYLRQKYQPEAFYCYATSFGGYLTLQYIHTYGSPFRKIALRCPAVNMYQAFTNAIMTPEDHARLQKGKDIPVGFDRKVLIGHSFLEEIQSHDVRQLDFLDYAEDILILHGTADEIISYDAAWEFADGQLIEFVPIEKADHRFRDPVKMDLAIKYILEFFAL